MKGKELSVKPRLNLHCTFNSTVNKPLPEKFCLLIERNKISSQYKDSWQLRGNPFQLQLQKQKIKFMVNQP